MGTILFLLLSVHPYCREFQLINSFLFEYMRILGNHPVVHFQGSVIQNMTVVSCRLSVSVFKVLVIQDLASFWIGLVRWYPIPPPVPSAGFDPRTSTSSVRRSTDKASCRTLVTIFVYIWSKDIPKERHYFKLIDQIMVTTFHLYVWSKDTQDFKDCVLSSFSS